MGGRGVSCLVQGDGFLSRGKGGIYLSRGKGGILLVLAGKGGFSCFKGEGKEALTVYMFERTFKCGCRVLPEVSCMRVLY